MKTLLHIDDTEKWPMLLSNASNIIAYIKETGDDISVLVVANGPAVTEYSARTASNTELHAGMQVLVEQGIRFAACRNAMRKHNIEAKELFPFVSTVASGVVELIQKQAEGYAYVKP